MDFGRQGLNLFERIVIAAEQDHPANLWMHQPFTFVIGEGFAGDVDHYRAKGQRELR